MASFWDDFFAKADRVMNAESWDHAMEEMNTPIIGVVRPREETASTAPPGSQLQRADNASRQANAAPRQARSPSTEESSGREPFCPMMNVTDPAGLTLKINLHIVPEPQQDCADIVKLPDDELFVKMFLAEGGNSCADHGVLMESSHGFPVAFVNTSEVHAGEPSGILTIMRPSPYSDEPLPEPYAYAERTPGTGIVNVRYERQDGPLILTVRIDMSAKHANVTDARGALLATLTAGKDGKGAFIRITQDMDAALALSSIVAGFKLSDFTQSSKPRR